MEGGARSRLCSACLENTVSSKDVQTVEKSMSLLLPSHAQIRVLA